MLNLSTARWVTLIAPAPDQIIERIGDLLTMQPAHFYIAAEEKK